MKAVILAGGLGTRMNEETSIIPKPLIEIGGKPILWHILKIYSAFGINEFIICCGYKGHLIKDYFLNYFMQLSDLTINFLTNNISVHQINSEPWQVTLVDTGEGTMTGGRLKRVQDYIGNKTFCVTYGDGVGDVNIQKLIEFHVQQKVLATLTAVQRPDQFGVLEISANKVRNFQEKPLSKDNWINGGFFILEPEVFQYIPGDLTVWEREPLADLAKEGKLAAYQHKGFWHSMDTLKDKDELEKLWHSQNPPWRVWP